MIAAAARLSWTDWLVVIALAVAGIAMAYDTARLYREDKRDAEDRGER